MTEPTYNRPDLVAPEPTMEELRAHTNELAQRALRAERAARRDQVVREAIRLALDGEWAALSALATRQHRVEHIDDVIAGRVEADAEGAPP